MSDQRSRRADEAQTLLEVQQAITSRLDPDDVLQLIADHARRLTHTRGSAVYLLLDDELRLAVISGETVSGLKIGHRVSLEGSVSGIALATGQPVIVHNTDDESRVPPDVVQLTGLKSYLVVPLISGTQPIGMISVGDKQDGELGEDDERILSVLASSAVIGLENARLYSEEQARRYEAEQRRQVAESLRETLRTLNSNRPLEEILKLIVAQAGRLLDTDTVAVFRLESDKGPLTIQASQGLSANYVKNIKVPLGEGVVGRAVHARDRVFVRNIGEMPWREELANIVARETLSREILDHYRALLAVPLFVKGAVYGGVVLFYPEVREFNEEEVQLAVTFCDQAALAIENARLRDQAEAAAAEAERSRLARELHDSVTQILFSASLVADVLPRLWERNAEEAWRRLEDLRQLTRGALAEMRTLLLELRPATLTEVELSDLIQQLCEAFTGKARIPATFTSDVESSLPPDIQITFYRLAQETLNNVLKHADAHYVKVYLKVKPGFVSLQVQDDGRGFDSTRVGAENLGLKIMRERADAIGAVLVIESEVGVGTGVNVIWREQERKI